MINMNKIIGALILIVAVGGMFVAYKKYNVQKLDKVVACPEDTRVCADGSTVVRIAPRCDFAECPVIKDVKQVASVSVLATGKLDGNVTIGPVCPADFAVKYPTFNCNPTAEMFAAAKIFVYKTDKTTLVKTITPDANGKFSVSLKEGEYFIDMIHQKQGGTKGVPVTITISKDKPVVLNVAVDTGLKEN